MCALVSVFALGCGDDQMDCEELTEEGLTFCDDFNDGAAAAWRAEAGATWTVEGGRYVGNGPEIVDPSICGASLMSASLRDGSRHTDVEVHVEAFSRARLDKVVVLRASDPSNRIELNFRGDPLNDLIVQELIDCELVYYTDEGEVVVPHGPKETIVIDATLTGDRLVVVVDGEPILDRSFPFAATEGLAGLAVIERASTVYDGFWMRRLDRAE